MAPEGDRVEWEQALFPRLVTGAADGRTVVEVDAADAFLPPGIDAQRIRSDPPPEKASRYETNVIWYGKISRQATLAQRRW
jgi:hypothetical protein